MDRQQTTEPFKSHLVEVLDSLDQVIGRQHREIVELKSVLKTIHEGHGQPCASRTGTAFGLRHSGPDLLIRRTD